MIKWKQEDMGFEAFGLDFGNPDFVRYAESYGASGHRVRGASELQPLLTDCLARPGVQLIDCPIDYSDSQRQLFETIPDASRAVS
jgi:acetolactate synthase-1/2/3 large subunit